MTMPQAQPTQGAVTLDAPWPGGLAVDAHTLPGASSAAASASAGLPEALAPGLRAMAMADIDGVMAIEQTAYAHPWTRGNFIDSLCAGYLAWLKHDAQTELVGYCVALPGYRETHLLNLTVRPARQRTGIGRALLANLTAWSRQRGDASLFLEVRASNLGARALYAAAGFEEVGLRCDYYPAAGLRREDAVVLRLSLAS